MEVETIERQLSSIEERIRFYEFCKQTSGFQVNIPELKELLPIYEELFRQWIVEMQRNFKLLQEQSGYSF